MNLVVVESPSKAKTINKYLGSQYKVISSVGHIIDLPKSKMGIDIDNNFSPLYTTIPGKEKVIKQILSEAKKSSKVILATDPDREGEAISWHIANQIQKKESAPIERIVFHEITKNAVQAALKNPRNINQDLVDAQQARRVLDRLVGYTLSPLLWKKIRYGLSAGRVQSVALRLIVIRERERDAFVPDEYWSVNIITTTKNSSEDVKIEQYLKGEEKKYDFENELSKGNIVLELKKYNNKAFKVKSKEEYKKTSEELKNSDITINDIKTKTVTKRPAPPFTTSTFQQACVNRLKLSARNSMRIAQKLYENGLITYMRTDSTLLSSGAVDQARKNIESKFGNKYLPDSAKIYKSKSKLAQEAHEAIRPTSFEVTSLDSKFNDKDQKVYNLIYNRALASQMSDAKFEMKTISAEAVTKDKNSYLFSSSAQKCLFDGWLKLYQVEDNKELIQLFDSLKQDTKLNLLNVIGTQHFTEPPARYTEASLIKELEKNGIGRPSTYASIVSVITERNYVEKDNRYFYPTETGKVVIRLLEENFDNVVDTGFTADMENRLDGIANGDIKWVPLIKEFWDPFNLNVEKKDKELKKDDFVNLGESDEKCPECGAKMNRKIGRFGVFLSCSKFPDCKGMKSENESEEEKLDQSSDEFLAMYKPAPKTDDGRDYLLKKGRFGQFWAHPDYPKVKDARPLEYTEKKLKELFGDPPKSKDGKKMVLRSGRFGHFWAHPDYPKVKEIQKVKKSKN